MTTLTTNNRLIKGKISRLKDKLVKEKERRIALIKEQKQVEKLENLVVVQNDKQSIAKLKKRIANI